MNKRMIIGVYGGTFSPPHLGHTKAAISFLEDIKPDKMYIVPAGLPPHKKLDLYASDIERLEMTKAAFLPLSEKISVLEYELNKDGPSYTVETLEYLSNEGKLMLLCGEDMFITLDTWHRAHDVFSLSEIVCVRRTTSPAGLEEIRKKHEQYIREYNAVIHYIDKEPFDISSSEIRSMSAAGKDISPYVPADVLKIIKENEIY